MSRIAASFLMLLAAWSPAQGGAEGRRQDLRFLALELPKRHIDPFTVVGEDAWREQVEALEQRLPGLDDGGAFEVELMKLVALMGDSHTQVAPQSLFASNLLPLALHWFSDGLYVLKAARTHQAMLGGRVVRVGDLSLDEAIRRLATVRVFDNRSSILAQTPGLLRSGNLLETLGISSSNASVTFEVERRGNKTRHVVPVGGFGAFPAHRRPRKDHVTARRASRWHHFEFLEDQEILYIQYNRCATSTQHDFGKFIQTLVKRCSTGDVKAIVFDLQYNGGGNSLLGDRMFARLARHPPMRQVKNTFCIIGRGTFSSGILNAETLKRRYGALLLGEPTGGSPNHFGELKSFELPHSKLQVWYSTKRFARGAPGTKTLKPDHVVPQSYSDYVTGEDSLLARVRRLMR